MYILILLHNQSSLVMIYWDYYSSYISFWVKDKWRYLSLSELTLMVFDTGLTHLDSEASKWNQSFSHWPTGSCIGTSIGIFMVVKEIDEMEHKPIIRLYQIGLKNNKLKIAYECFGTNIRKNSFFWRIHGD